MALKMLYRGPSSRLETLIEKIQQNKEVNQGAYILFILTLFLFYFSIKWIINRELEISSPFLKVQKNIYFNYLMGILRIT